MNENITTILNKPGEFKTFYSIGKPVHIIYKALDNSIKSAELTGNIRSIIESIKIEQEERESREAIEKILHCPSTTEYYTKETNTGFFTSLKKIFEGSVKRSVGDGSPVDNTIQPDKPWERE